MKQKNENLEKEIGKKVSTKKIHSRKLKQNRTMSSDDQKIVKAASTKEEELKKQKEEEEKLRQQLLDQATKGESIEESEDDSWVVQSEKKESSVPARESLRDEGRAKSKLPSKPAKNSYTGEEDVEDGANSLQM